MHRSLIPERVSLTLVVVAILLPIVICIVLGVAALLSAMDDAVGGTVLRGVALGVGILWTVDLVSLLLVLAVNAIAVNAIATKPTDSSDELREP
jgi:hypothetical protein